MICNLTQTVGSTPFDPSVHLPLMKMKYSNGILEDRFAKFGGINWFQPDVSVQEMTGDLKFSHSLRIRYKKYEKPYSKVAVSKVKYKDGETCPPVLETPCTLSCISTVPEYTTCDVNFDNEYQVGASQCVVNEVLTYEDMDQRYRESVDAARELQGLNAWNHLVCEAIADPAATLIPTDKECFPFHYIKAGNAAQTGYATLTKVIAYMMKVFGSDFSNFGVFAHPQFELDILGPNSTLHNYDKTGIPTAWGNVDALVQGGWKPMPALPGGLWQKPIWIASDSVDLYNGETNLNPFLSADMTKYYVLIASKRSFFTGVAETMPMIELGATCDNPFKSVQSKFMDFNKILFKNEVFVIEFDRAC